MITGRKEEPHSAMTVAPGNADLIDEVGVSFPRRFSPALVFSAFFASLLASFRSRAALQLEALALRHQLGVLHRSVKRPKLTARALDAIGLSGSFVTAR